jgi:hypothetical protein
VVIFGRERVTIEKRTAAKGDMIMDITTVKTLNNGVQMPVLGLGVF